MKIALHSVAKRVCSTVPHKTRTDINKTTRAKALAGQTHRGREQKKKIKFSDQSYNNNTNNNNRVGAQLHYNICKEMGVQLDTKHRYEHVSKFSRNNSRGKGHHIVESTSTNGQNYS